jgi:hypothetical protein
MFIPVGIYSRKLPDAGVSLLTANSLQKMASPLI